MEKRPYYPQRAPRYCDTCGRYIGMFYPNKHYCPECMRLRINEASHRTKERKKLLLNITTRPYIRYSRLDTQFIVNNYGTMWLDEIAHHLGRDYESVCHKIYQLKKNGIISWQQKAKFA